MNSGQNNAGYNRQFIDQRIDVDQFAHKVVNKLNSNLTIAQMKRAIEKFMNQIIPRVYLIQIIHTVASAIIAGSVNIDSTYSFFMNAWTAWPHGTQDTDYYITNFSQPSGTNLIAGNLQFPLGLLTRWTGFPLEFPWYVPANSQIQITTQNGSTTAATTTDFAFLGVNAPSTLIKQIENGTV